MVSVDQPIAELSVRWQRSLGTASGQERYAKILGCPPAVCKKSGSQLLLLLVENFARRRRFFAMLGMFAGGLDNQSSGGVHSLRKHVMCALAARASLTFDATDLSQNAFFVFPHCTARYFHVSPFWSSAEVLQKLLVGQKGGAEINATNVAPLRHGLSCSVFARWPLLCSLQAPWPRSPVHTPCLADTRRPKKPSRPRGLKGQNAKEEHGVFEANPSNRVEGSNTVFVRMHLVSMAADLSKPQVSQLLPNSGDPLLSQMRNSIRAFFNAALQSQISTKDVVQCNERTWRTTKYSEQERKHVTWVSGIIRTARNPSLLVRGDAEDGLSRKIPFEHELDTGREAFI